MRPQSRQEAPRPRQKEGGMNMPVDLSALLEEIGNRNSTASTYDEWHQVGRDGRALLAALRTVLEEHRKTTVYALSVLARDNGNPPKVWCGHTYEETGNDRHVIGDDDSVLCLDKPEGKVCSSCRGEDGEPVDWPCREYKAIIAALNGKEAGDAQ
jgi:hypothetical protein